MKTIRKRTLQPISGTNEFMNGNERSYEKRKDQANRYQS
jgi:hypothetical protein